MKLTKEILWDDNFINKTKFRKTRINYKSKENYIKYEKERIKIEDSIKYIKSKIFFDLKNDS